MDGEVLDKELMGTIARDDSMKETWQRYHLIRDTMRGDGVKKSTSISQVACARFRE